MGATSEYSNIYVRASGGAAIYMDLQVEPPPIVEADLEQSTIKIAYTYMLPTTADAIWAIYLTANFAPIYVNIDDGAGERLCRWKNFRRITGGGKRSYSYEMEFTILTDRSTYVNISDSDGSNVVTLDYEPYPFPEPIQQRDRTQRIEFDSLYITRTKADLLRAKFPNDVRIKLSSTGSTYLCRWQENGLQIKPTTSTNLSVSIRLEVIMIVSASASSTIYIYDANGANAVQLDFDPYPFPTIYYQRNTYSVKGLPYLNGSTLTSGIRKHFDGGIDVSDGTIEFSVPYLSASKITTLETRYFLLASVQVSLNSGSTKYRCIFADFKRSRFGNPSEGVSMKFNIIETV